MTYELMWDRCEWHRISLPRLPVNRRAWASPATAAGRWVHRRSHRSRRTGGGGSGPGARGGGAARRSGGGAADCNRRILRTSSAQVDLAENPPPRLFIFRDTPVPMRSYILCVSIRRSQAPLSSLPSMPPPGGGRGGTPHPGSKEFNSRYLKGIRSRLLRIKNKYDGFPPTPTVMCITTSPQRPGWPPDPRRCTASQTHDRGNPGQTVAPWWE